jgi:hypothetical protein
MSQLTPRRINVEDLKGAPSWAPPLVGTLNLFMEDVVRNVNGRLHIGDNISGQVFTTSFTTPPDYSTGSFTAITFNYLGKIQPSSVLIGDLSCTKPIEPILTATSAYWSYNNNVVPNQIRVTYIAGLKPNQTYSVTLVAF